MFLQNFLVALPLFCIIGLGYCFAHFKVVTTAIGNALSKFSFTVTIPILLFRLMSDLPNLPTPNWMIGVAFFGSCFIVFLIGYFIGKYFLHLTRDGQTLFGMAGVFSNNIQLGVPIAISLLGKESLPSIAVIFSLNGFLMWTLATVAIELGRNQNPSFLKTLVKGTSATIRNPIVIGIVLGALWGLSGITLPTPIQKSVDLLANSAAPVALFAVGVGLTQYKITSNFKITSAVTILKLCVQPIVVFLLCHLIGLNFSETKAACLLACLPVGVNVYIMSQEFKTMQGETANALLITTALASFTVPLTLTLFGLE